MRQWQNNSARGAGTGAISGAVVVGGGLHWQTHQSTDRELDVRFHFNFSGVDADQINRFWTVGLNFGFGI